MANGKSDNNTTQLVRTSILITEDTDRALRELADEGKRPLSWEIRHALEQYVEQAKAAA
jgi:predicted transcriptional regulator